MTILEIATTRKSLKWKGIVIYIGEGYPRLTTAV
jgi:hypothetical protein